MAWTATLTVMLAELMARAGLRRSATLTEAIRTSFINSGIAEVHDLIAKHNPDFLVTSSDVVTVSGTATVALPGTLYKLRRVDLIEGGVATRLRQFQIDEETYIAEGSAWDSGGTTGRYRYMLQAANIRLVPVPAGVDTLRLWFIPHAVKLVTGADTYNGVNGHEDLVYEHALRLMKARDRMDTSVHDQAIARLEKRLLSALEARDQSEPEYLPDLRRGEMW